MAFVCKDLPCRLIEVKPNAIGRHYKNGLKFCSICSRFMLVELGRCPCCKNKLRCKPANKIDRKKYL